MKDGDYICRAYQNTVALGGITDEATLDAIEKFVSEILPTSEYGHISDEGLLFEFIAEEIIPDPTPEPSLECEIVYPKGSSADVVMAARELSELLSAQTGMLVTAHRYESKYDPEKLYVVIGMVSDDVTEYWYDGMKDGDYICRAYQNTIAIGGITDDATLEAIQCFIAEVLPNAKYGNIANEGVIFEHRELPVEDSVILNGYGLGEYTLVVKDPSLRAPAGNFKERLYSLTGYDLAVLLDEPSDDAKEIVVLINNAVGQSKYRIYGYGDNIFVESDSIYGVSLALSELLSRLCVEDMEDVNTVDIYDSESYAYSNPVIQTAYYRISKNVGTSTEALEAVARDIKQSGADIVTLRFDNRYIFNALKTYLFEDFGITALECTDGGVVAILNRPNMTSVKQASMKFENGIDVVYAEIDCLGKKYDVFCLYPREIVNSEVYSGIVEDCFASAVNSVICTVVSSANDGTTVRVAEGEAFSCAFDEIVSSGAAKYRVYTFVTSSLDCFEQKSVFETDGRYVGVLIGAREGFLAP